VSDKKKRLIIGISGSSGAILGIRLLEVLRSIPIETHLIVSSSARLTIEQETQWKVEDVLALADFHYNPRDIAAPVASGSFATMGMVVIPCSIKSLSSIANSYSGDLLARAADVTLKEGRSLLLVVREAPLHPGHIRLMELAAAAGAVIFPPVPAFYAHPHSVDELVNNIVGRVLSRIGIENELYMHWQGLEKGQVEKEQPPAPAAAAGMDPEEEAPCADELWALPAMTLATTGADGSPHAAAVYFAADADRRNLYFFSDPASQHSQDLAVRPCAAAAVHPVVGGWEDIRGLQMRGEVRTVPAGDEWQRGWSCYLVKFPFAGDLQAAISRSTLYTFRPDWIRWSDNRRGFGHKEEWTLP